MDPGRKKVYDYLGDNYFQYDNYKLDDFAAYIYKKPGEVLNASSKGKSILQIIEIPLT